MGVCACLWKSMGFMRVYEGFWESMDKHEYMSVYGCLWVSMGGLWESIDKHEYLSVYGCR